MAVIGNDAGTDTGGVAAAIPVWKTITIGTHHTVEELRDALLRKRMWIGDLARAALDLPALTLAEAETEIDLAILSVGDLGLGPGGVTFADVAERAKRRGLGLCPAEVALQLRLQYPRQPVGEFLLIAMEPIALPDGQRILFMVGNGGAGLAIVGRQVGSDDLIEPSTPLVFVVPR